MSVTVGKTVYSHGTAPCSGIGLIWAAKDLDAALNGHVAAVLFDDKGKAEVKAILSGLVETDFAQEGLAQVLSSPKYIEDWRVGEAIAEAYLTDHRTCCFPWPAGRDERKGGSSLPGADLVGFGTDDNGDCLAFGEVKTSSESKYPPSVMHGPEGLRQQLENLRDQEVTRDKLLKYLSLRASSAPWLPRFKAAGKRYLQNKSDVHLYGVLIRDVPPHSDDLRVCVRKLAKNCPQVTHIEILAIYLPKGRIAGIGQAMVTKRTGVAP